MKMLGALLIVSVSVGVLLLAISVGARASSDEFAFQDATLDAMPPPANAWADLTGGHVVLDGETLRASVVVHLLPEVQPGMGYGVLFSDGKSDWYMAVVTVPTLAYYYGHWNDGPLDFAEGTGSYTTGTSATLTIEAPVDAIADATVLSDLRGLTADVKTLIAPTGGGMIMLDEAVGSGTLTIRGPATQPGGAVTDAATVSPASGPGATSPTPDATSAVPGAGVAVVAAAGAVALLGRRRV